MKKSIIVTVVIFLIAIACYVLYNSGKEEGEAAKRMFIKTSRGN